MGWVNSKVFTLYTADRFFGQGVQRLAQQDGGLRAINKCARSTRRVTYA